MTDTTAALTASMAAGNEEAVAVFYRRYFDRLYAQARRATGRDESFCLDVVQDAVIRVIRTVRPVKSEQRFMAWLGLVVKTTAFDHLRREQRRRRHETAFAVAGSSVDATVTSLPENSTADQMQWLRQELDAFDPQLARMLEMRYQKGQSLRLIAEFFGLSIGSVDGRLRRALKELHHRSSEATDE